MKAVTRISSCILLSLISLLTALSLLTSTAEAKSSASSPVHPSPQEQEFITYTIYLPYIKTTSSSLAYGIQVDPSNYTSNITHVHNLGFEWVKFHMAWKDVEPSPGDLRWSEWDERINAYRDEGIKILLTITKAPYWARSLDDDKDVDGLPHNAQTYANFVISVTNHYTGNIQAIEVWKDQNIFYEVGGMGRVDPQQYMSLLQATYTAIKIENPDIIVVSGALVPTGAPVPLAMDDREYLQQMYALGLKDFSDAIGAQPSGFANPPDALYTGGDYDPNRGYDDHRSFFFRNTMEDYHQIIVEAGDLDKPIWATEFGWPVWRYEGDARFEFAKETSLKEQAEYSRRAYEMGKDWGWVGAMFLWNLDYAITAPNAAELANFSILTTAGPTPAYEALRDMPK